MPIIDNTPDSVKMKEVYAGIRSMKLGDYLADHEHIHKIIMQDVIRQMSPKYSCLRPPGAAGAALLVGRSLVFGDVRPADGSPTCKDLGECLMEDGHCVRTIHAEVRAILNAATMSINPEGGVMYSILKPCFQCTKVIIASGIKKVVYAGAAYDEERTSEISDNAGLEYFHMEVDLNYGQELVK